MSEYNECEVRLLCIEAMIGAFLHRISSEDDSGRAFLSTIIEEAARDLEDMSLRSGARTDSKVILRALDHLDTLRAGMLLRLSTSH